MFRTITDARIRAAQKARHWLELKPVYLDTETTGLSSLDEVIEIAIIDHDGQTLLQTLVKPRRPIPPDAIRIHGINDSAVANAPIWDEIWPTVRSMMDGRSIGIYNDDFDIRMMKQSFRVFDPSWRNSFTSFDILKLYAEFFGEIDPRRGSFRYQSLAKAGAQCEIELPNAHRALADALLAREVLLFMGSWVAQASLF